MAPILKIQLYSISNCIINLYSILIKAIIIINQRLHLLKLISTIGMNQFYQKIEALLHSAQPDLLTTFIADLNSNPGNLDPDYQCGLNIIYAIKRFINSSMARDYKIKNNSFKCLTQISKKVAGVSSLKYSKFQQFYLQASDHKKHGQGKKLETEAYVSGKLMVVSSLWSIFKDQEAIINSLIQLIGDYPNFQEEIIQCLYLISKSKQNKSLLKKVSISTLKAKILLKLLTSKESQNVIDQTQINQILGQAQKQYPKPSISLKYCGGLLSKCVKSPALFFKNKFIPYFKQESQEQKQGEQQQSLKKLYYLLYLQKYFLNSITISQQNLANFISIEMINTWIQQLRVKNRQMKSLTTSIHIKFVQDSDFAFTLLQNLHQNKVYLQNVSANHPLIQLYRNVDATKYWQYLISLAKQQVQDVQMVQQLLSSKQEQYLSELQFFVRERSQNLTIQQIGSTFSLLIDKSRQRKNNSQKLLNLVWSLFYSLCLHKNKKIKKIILNTKGSNIISKINIEQCRLEAQQINQLKLTIKFMKIQVKNSTQEQDKVKICFLNFLIALVLYVIIYPEEIQVLTQIKFIKEDLQKLYNVDEAIDKVKKKTKKNEQVDPKMPIHVLVDIFISLLTKAPIFLRNTINLLFEQMIPHIESSDLDTLLDVIQKPDQSYIEQI